MNSNTSAIKRDSLGSNKAEARGGKADSAPSKIALSPARNFFLRITVLLHDIALSNSAEELPFVRNDIIASTNFIKDPAIIVSDNTKRKKVLLATIPLV